MTEELREEFVVCHAAGYPDPHRPHPNTREYAHRFAGEHRRLPEFPAVVKRRLVSEWTEEPNAATLPRPGSRSILGATVVSVRSKSGRRWYVQSFNASSDEYRLDPLGDDVRPAQDRHGRMNGGPRSIRVAYERLWDPKAWARVG